MTKGFITVVTGNERYYKMALDLLRSYRLFSKAPLPFCIITDEGNPYINEFDDYAIMSNPENSFMNKLKIYNYLPYDENIFIDADCLAYADLNVLFDFFPEKDDFSCCGHNLPLKSEKGMFNCECLGDIKLYADYNLDINGGLYFIRKSPVSEKVFADAQRLIPRFYEFKFRSDYKSPSDEPLLALAMAMNDCRAVTDVLVSVVALYYLTKKELRFNMLKASIKYTDREDRPVLMHWGSWNTLSRKYKIQVAQLDYLTHKTSRLSLTLSYIDIYIKALIKKVKSILD